MPGPEPATPQGTVQTGTPGYGIRQAHVQDVAQIHALMREMAEFENLTGIFQATESSLHKSLFGEQPAARALVAHPEGRPDTVIAYALWFHNYSSFLDKRGLYLEDIYVQAAHRGLGIGRMVLRHLARLAVELDCGRFEWTVLDWNRNAIDFYESHGASVLPDWRIVRLTGEPLRRLAGTSAA
jgi:GNAT superfamily N-acetyltransferase